MAEKVYLDLVGLRDYDTRIKGVISAGDTAALAAARAAQDEVDNLETLVGTVPAESGAKSVIEYIEKKTDGIATDAALAELQGKVTTLIGEDAEKSVRTIANEELAAQLIPESAAEALDTLQEIASWIQSHPDDASAMNKAIDALEKFVGELPEGATATTVVAYIEQLIAAEENRATAAENGLSGRIDELEKVDHSHANKAVLDGIDAGKVANWDEAYGKRHDHANKAVIDGIKDTDVTAWNKAVVDAGSALDSAGTANAEIGKLKTYVGTIPTEGVTSKDVVSYISEKVAVEQTRAEGIEGGLRTDVTALQGASHTHDNKTVLDGITSVNVTNWNSAHGAMHTHANKDVIDGITSAKVDTWDGYAAKIQGLEDKVGDGFVAITTAEIEALFAAQ